MNKRVAIEIPEETHKLIARYAQEAGAQPGEYLLEVIERHLEDLHDIAVVEAVLERRRRGEEERTYTWEEMEFELGLDD